VECGGGWVAADRAGDELDEEIDQCFRHEHLRLLWKAPRSTHLRCRAKSADYGDDPRKIDWTEVQPRVSAAHSPRRSVRERERRRREARGGGGQRKRASGQMTRRQRHKGVAACEGPYVRHEHAIA